MQARAQFFREMVNGNLCQPRFSHVEIGCCPGSLPEINRKFAAALVAGAGVLLSSSGLPTDSRWGTLADSQIHRKNTLQASCSTELPPWLLHLRSRPAGRGRRKTRLIADWHVFKQKESRKTRDFLEDDLSVDFSVVYSLIPPLQRALRPEIGRSENTSRLPSP